jgi:predicted transcriptional regulator
MSTQTTTLSVRLPRSLKRKLERLAASTSRSPSWLAADAIATYVDLHAWQVGAIEEGVADADAGRLVDHEDVAAWLATWGTRRKASPP